MKSIIVGTDFSEGSYVALELAIDIANRMQCDILLVWVRREKMLFTGEQMDMLTNLAKDKLQALCEKHQPAMKYGTIHHTIVNGKVSTAIAEVAKRELAPMIVIGTNGASGFEKFVIGSQAARIAIDKPRQFAHAIDLSVGNVTDVATSIEWKHVVFAEAIDFDVPDDYHVVALFVEDSLAHNVVRIFYISS